jgi:hypothetical protein
MRFLILAAALALSGCATTYQLNVMPRDSGKMYSGIAQDSGYGEGTISVTIENKTYSGTWVQATPSSTTGYVSGGFGWGARRGYYGGYGLGGMITMDNPAGSEAKALLSSSDGAGLRCDFRSGQGFGGGVCRDDSGKEYDVQLRPAPRG